MNYIKCDDWSLTKYSYMFIDTKDYLADQIFINHKLMVYFGQEMVEPESGYYMIFCKIHKKDESIFLQCMGELRNKMLILGNTDYIDFCDEFIKKLINKNK